MRQATLRRALAAAAVAAGVALAPHAAAQELKIAVAADVTSIDPHFFNLFPNNNIAEHIFDKLVQMDADSRMIPGLATSWKAIDATTWEFRLRKGVKFHDGSELTADDVAFSIDRVAQIPNSPGPFVAYTKAIVGKEIVDPYTIRFKTAAPHPLMPNDLSTIYIVSRKVATGASTEDFNTGKATVGSGRFKFVRYVNGDRVELARNDAYWGEKPPYEKVTFRIVKNEASRVAALLSGDVDAIEQPPIADLPRLKADPKFTVTSKISHRVIYFNFDHLDRVSPFVTGKDGKPLAKNPFLDLRVRKAVSKAINRQAIADRVMEGQATPAGQLVSEKLFGNVPGMKAEPYDPDGAKKLLAEAGYPDGFNLTIHGPAGRYVNDEKIVQAVAQMLTRVGIVSKVETAPMAPYSGRASKQEFSFHMVGWGASTGEASSPLRSLLATFNRDKGLGAVNWGRYSNAKVDYVIEQALQQVDDDNRRAMLQQATKLSMDDLGIMPVHFQYTIWATKKNVAYTPRTDEYTLAFQFRPAKG
ncbi:MAG TPA: ABC transporter substrate-binding protein [Casimicrobiaceae bacterium]|jgi:peptide/nickel transport system substrate-binding protein|nr:ABC transporter substrate-binding protein [Casimicrobiaceae bacterium]